MYGYFSQPLSSLEGGSTLVITNCTGNIGNGSDITNVLFGSTATTNILGQGTNWIAVVIPATNAPADVYIQALSHSAGQLVIRSINNSDASFHYLIKAIEGYPLMLGVSSANGNIKVYRKFGTNTVYTREYYSQIPSYLQLVNGTTTNRFSGNFTAVSNSMPDSGTINFVMDAGDTGVRITQVLRYVNGKNYFTKQWRIANMGATDYTDVRFLHGGDTFFANSDLACGYHNADLDMVYLKNPNAAGLMGFYGGYNSRSDRYCAGDLGLLYGGLNVYWLSNSINTNFADAGYALQWNTNSLAAGTEWTITAYEKWTDAGDVQVIAASDLSGELGASVTGVFTVVNFQTNLDTFSLSPSINQAGWTASLLGETNLTLASGASSNILVQVTIGSRTSCVVTLTAASQTLPAVTNSDSLTVSGPIIPPGTADIGVSDFVYLPVNTLALANPGTISCRVTNNGPDALVASGVGFDFYMGSNDAAMALIGSAQSDLTLAVGQEVLVVLSAAAKQGVVVPSDLSGMQTAKVTVRHLSSLYDPNLANNTTAAAGTVRVKTSGANSIGRGVNDYDGDGKSDAGLYESGVGRWYAELSGDYYGVDHWIGDIGAGWVPVAGDYDGDGLTDVAAYNRANGHWRVRYTSNGLFGECWLGGPDFAAAQCDFDGDAKTDPTVYREADGYWLGLASSRHFGFYYAFLGGAGYQAVVADYDGDGLADPAVYNQATGLWIIYPSQSIGRIMTRTFGGVGYLPASADYDGDGLVDPAVYAPSTAEWQAWLSGSLATQGYYTWWGGVFGDPNGIPVPADYDGDGKADPAVCHSDTAIWQIFRSTDIYRSAWGLFGRPGLPVLE